MSVRAVVGVSLCIKPMADGPSFSYEFLQEIGPCVISSRTSFFLVRETWMD